MGLFDFFPYTSGHTLNLDWIIKTIKKTNDELENLNKNIDSVVYKYLEEHPEVVVALENNSVTLEKLAEDVRLYVLSYDYLNVEMLGAKLDGVTDDTPVLQAALNSGKLKLLIPRGKTCLLKNLSLPSNSSLKNDGTIYAPDYYKAIVIKNAENVSIIGGNIIGGNSNEGQSGIDVVNSRNCIIDSVRVSQFLNKCISLSNGTTESFVVNCCVEGATGSSGAGISISSETSRGNTIKNCVSFNNRIGIILQSCVDNLVDGLYATDSVQSALMIDGTVTGSGDGGYNNIINNVISRGLVSESFAHIYLGNGSHNNVIAGFNLTDGRYGLRENGAGSNNFTGGFITNCIGGALFSTSPRTQLTDTIITGSHTGVTILASNWTAISNNSIKASDTGISSQFEYGTFVNNVVDAPSYGLRIEYGQGTPRAFVIENNFFINCATPTDLDAGIIAGETNKSVTTD